MQEETTSGAQQTAEVSKRGLQTRRGMHDLTLVNTHTRHIVATEC